MRVIKPGPEIKNRTWWVCREKARKGRQRGRKRKLNQTGVIKKTRTRARAFDSLRGSGTSANTRRHAAHENVKSFGTSSLQRCRKEKDRRERFASAFFSSGQKLGGFGLKAVFGEKHWPPRCTRLISIE